MSSEEAVPALIARMVADRDAAVVPMEVVAPTSAVVASPADQPILGQVRRSRRVALAVSSSGVHA